MLLYKKVILFASRLRLEIRGSAFIYYFSSLDLHQINRTNLVWALETTCIPMAKGFLYLTAIVDWWASRKVAAAMSNRSPASPFFPCFFFSRGIQHIRDNNRICRVKTTEPSSKSSQLSLGG
jgi:hypothetical protein